jgi:hypothetical protein
MIFIALGFVFLSFVDDFLLPCEVKATCIMKRNTHASCVLRLSAHQCEAKAPHKDIVADVQR